MKEVLVEVLNEKIVSMPSLRSTMKRWQYLGIGLSFLLVGAALVSLHHILAEVHLRDVLARFHGISWSSLVLSSFCVGGSYFALTGYDVLALRYLGRPLPYATTAPASFISYTFSHNIGLSLITGGSIRYRMYSPAGFSAVEIATLTGLCALTFGLGVSLMLGLALMIEPESLALMDGLPVIFNRVLGLLILLGVGGYTAMTGRSKQTWQLRNWTVALPSFQMTFGQLALGAADISLAASALYFVLPPDAAMSFPGFIGIYVAAMTIGVLSHAPGGLGVFEAVMLLAFSHVEPGALFGSLLVYRCLYYLLPFGLAACILVWHERQWGSAVLTPTLQILQRGGHAAAPLVLGGIVFAGGVILLFSSATPILEVRLMTLRHYVPLPFIEASHLLSSVVGLWLMILSRGLFRRMESAFHVAQWVLCGGILFSLLKGFDYEEACLLGLVWVLLVSSHGAFYRKTSLWDQSFTMGWLGTMGVFVVASIWLGIFSYKHVKYSHDLWWEFAYRSDVSRTLRGLVAVMVLGLGFLVFQVVRRVPPQESLTPDNMASIRSLVGRALHTDANLALLGDKRFLLSQEESAFVMYQIVGRSWVVMGDPVGEKEAWEPLLWRFRELCDQYDGWPVFYQIGSENLPQYLDMGLTLLKIGEEARVDLSHFSLEGSRRKALRHAVGRTAKEHAVFELVPANQVHVIMEELAQVSDEWLAERQTGEKGFSVGRFSSDYLEQFDAAVVRWNGKIVAFANIWLAPEGHELSVDLMRHRHEISYGTMDFLFINLMFWGKGQGYLWFNLGMAPLSGLESHPLSSVWNRIGTLIFRHGEHFYNFEGLRAFKEKYDPVWTSKYLVVPGGIALPQILFDVAALVSGGTKKIFHQ